MLKYLICGLSLVCSVSHAAETQPEHCLALASYYEVRAHPTEYINVFHVIENRTKLLGMDYCAVVFQKNTVKIKNRWRTRYQFSWTPYYQNKIRNEEIYQRSLKQARSFLKNTPRDTTKGALYFTRHQDDQTWFAKNFKIVLRTPLHVYYGTKNIKTTS